MEMLIYFGVFSVLVLVLCVARPHAGRIFLGIFFLIMAIAVNITLVFFAPEQFVALGVDGAILPMYQWFFENVVASAPRVLGLIAAACEITVGLLILHKGTSVKVGLVGGIVFLIAITPLGIWTLANPLLALAMAYLLTKRFDRSLPEMVRSAIQSRRAFSPSRPPAKHERPPGG